MMFITPMPPTSSPRLEIAIAIKPTIAVMLSNCSINLSAVLISKLFGSPNFTLRRRRRISSDLLQRFSHLPGAGADHQQQIALRRRDFLRGAERNENGVVFLVLTKEAGLSFLQHADDFEVVSAHSHLRAGDLWFCPGKSASAALTPMTITFARCWSSMSVINRPSLTQCCRCPHSLMIRPACFPNGNCGPGK